ncbi:MAG: hypothetical protein AUG49_04225 [Catenulispora sp. 13_1_20CM_3_70_7]|nr:MAG: hypothetical protein AUG49_04225 [Catenulispora sp. 13_1_20CM_3_70_7]
MVLATLLCQPDLFVPTDQLVDSVWGANPPRTATKNLQVHIYHLRRAIGVPHRIERRFTGYRLRAEPSELDAWRFEQLLDGGQRALDRGDVEEAERRYEAAIALWRGNAFADLEHSGVVARDALRLEELRLVALEGRAEARLRGGGRHKAIAELYAMLAEHPFRERLAARLMGELHRDGRQSEALDVFHRVRRALAEEMGIDPGPELAAAYRGILEGTGAAATSLPRRTPIDRQRLDWLVGVVDVVDRTLSPARPERVTVADAPVPVPPELHHRGAARRWLDHESDSLYAAVEAGAPDQMWRLAHGMYSLMRLRGRWREWISLYETAIAAATDAGAHRAVAALYVGLGEARSGAGDLDDAVASYATALSVARHHGSVGCQVAALDGLARFALRTHRLGPAERHLAQAEALAADDLDAFGAAARLSSTRAGIELARGRYDAAVEWFERALAVAVALGDSDVAVPVLCGLSDALRCGGDRSGAAASARQALAVAVACHDRPAEHRARQQLVACTAPALTKAG